MAEAHEEPLKRDACLPPSSPRTSRGQQRRRQRSVFQYITILFAAALVLLLYTFMMERRQFEQQSQQQQADISTLQKESVSAVQTLQGLLAENELLKEQVQSLETDKTRLEEQVSNLESQTAQLQQQAERTGQALDWFWQIDEAYVRGRTKQCQELIARFEETGLKDALPQESATDTERSSPAERYQEIFDKLS